MAITLQSLNREISIYNKRIAAYEKEIERLQSIIHEIEVKKEALISFEENTPIAERTLKKYITKTTETIELMDRFEQLTPEHFYKYVRLIDTGVYRYSETMGFQFIIERLGGRIAVDDISMTEYKNEDRHSLIMYARNQIKEYLIKNPEMENENTEILFEKPFKLRAQNSSNRKGYVNKHNGLKIVNHAVLYGETTNYAFVGVVYLKRRRH